MKKIGPSFLHFFEFLNDSGCDRSAGKHPAAFTNPFRKKESVMRPFLSLAFKSVFIASMVFGGSAMAAPDRIGLNADYRLSGPYTYQNLSVFLIHCQGMAGTGNQNNTQVKPYIPLAEALEKGIVTIHETGDVNRLAATNHSDTAYIYIQSGDIVKGGQQDRTMSQDMVLVPGAKKVPLDSFCVEQGRWSKRGNEESDRFSSSTKGLSSKELKLAAKQAKSQGAVWEAVAKEQEKLAGNIGKSVRNSASATSLQLTLEDKEVERKGRQYIEALLPIGRNEKDAAGFAFAVNGRFNCADIYGDPALFQKLWPKLLEAASYESLSLYDDRKEQASMGINEIKAHLLDGLNSRKTTKPLSSMTQRSVGETTDNHTFETKDEQDRLIHVNIIKK
jgi:hypothetical protein